MSMSTTAKANNAGRAVKADYEILVTLIDKKVVPHIPAPLAFGKTVRYKSANRTGHYAGEVTIEFIDNGSPYQNLDGSPKLEVSSNDPPLTLSREGNFTGRCYIRTPEGEEYGWGPDYPDAGGNHDVR
jgi:hypothetical protein